MSELKSVEKVCDERAITLVIHPAIRRALTGSEEEFAIRAGAFLRGGRSLAYFLPLFGGGDVKLVFSLRYSAGEHQILRVETERAEGLTRIKEAVRRSDACK